MSPRPLTQTTQIPLSVYVHLPWCVAKCPYCDFNSHELRGEGQFERYARALLADLDQDVMQCKRRNVETVFFGGGTPSLFPPRVIGAILDGIKTRLPFIETMEVTLEANPGTVERGLFADYRDAGINRVSLGAQSFDNALLRSLGRIHSASETFLAVQELREAGFDNFNLDLMYGLPGQTVEQSVSDLVTALRLGPAHLSHYQLTLEPNTVFYKNPPKIPDEDTAWAMQTACHEVLAKHNFQQYEVSAFARSGHECRHNLNYWHFGDYLGLGAGAHGKLTDLDNGQITRTAKLRSPQRYMDHAGTADRIATTRTLNDLDTIFEYMLNALRLNQGFDATDFETLTGIERTRIDKRLHEAENRGLLVQHAKNRWAASGLGFRFLNDLTEMFLEDRDVFDPAAALIQVPVGHGSAE